MGIFILFLFLPCTVPLLLFLFHAVPPIVVILFRPIRGAGGTDDQYKDWYPVQME